MDNPFDFQELREYAFGIVDAGMVEQLPNGLYAQPLVPKRLTQSAHLMPALIDLRRTPSAQQDVLFGRLKRFDGNGKSPVVALFIKSDCGVLEIMRHWNAMQFVELQHGRKQWLRLHDPRVLHQMLRVLNPMECRKLFGLSQALTYWVSGQWVTAVRPPSPLPGNQVHKNGRVAPYAGPARWNWSRIERIGLVNRALLAAGISEPAALTRQGALAEQLIERAAGRHALFEPPDLVEFAVRGLQIHPAFDEHRAVADAIRPDAASAGASTLADRFALIDEQIWNSMRQPLNLTGDSHDECGNKMRVL